MEEKPKGLSDYLDFLKRRKYQILFPMVIIFLLSIGVVILLPPVYRSTATILIEEQEIPRELVRSTVTGFADQRIEVIKQRVMSRASLLKVIEQYGLYADLRNKNTTEAVLEQMADDMNLEVISAEVTDQRTGRPTNATIAFTLSYDGAIPPLTQQVANELTSLFLAENLKIRERNAQETTIFLKEEAEKLFNRTEEIEKKIAAFKKKNAGALPELVQFNMQLLEQTNRDLMDVEQQIRSLEDREIYLEGQLATIKPELPIVTARGERILNSMERLKVLRSEYVSLSAHLSPEHPDLIKMKREIHALEQVVGETNDIVALEQKVTDERIRFQGLLEQFGEEHPDVTQSRKIITALEREIDKLSQMHENTPKEKPENPAYITIQAQLASTQNDLKALAGTKEKLKAQRSEYSRRIETTPMVEREYKSLIRDRDNLVAKYHEIRSKLLEAEVAEGLESQRKGERFSLIEPPALPERPVKPNRPAILFLGFVFALAGGFGFGAAAEGLDGTIYHSGMLEKITGVSPLGIIPIILNAEDRLHLIKQRRSLVVGTTGILIFILVAVHYLFYPLDVILFAVLRTLKA